MAKEVKKINSNEAPSEIAAGVLIEPWITEASTAAVELNKYIFKVSPSSVKGQIRKAIEELYKVKVTAVNMIKLPRKARNYGRTPGFKPGIKKAIVTLKKGDKIELFEGV